MKRSVFFQLMTYKVFSILNESLFGDALPIRYLKIGIWDMSIDGALVLAHHGKNDDGVVHYIDLDPMAAFEIGVKRGVPFWYAYTSVLLHEMVHYDCDIKGVSTADDNGWHNDVFRDQALAHCLTCQLDNRGWNLTWLNDDPFSPSMKSSLKVKQIIELYGRTAPFDRVILAPPGSVRM